MVRLLCLVLIPALACAAPAKPSFSASKGLHVDPVGSKRQKRPIGAGVVNRGSIMVDVDPKTGRVKRARLLQSTGQRTRDYLAVKAFRKWRFKPGTISPVTIPILLPSSKITQDVATR